MRVIIDAMGGDNAPQAPVAGAVRARRELGVDVTLVGRREDIERHLGGESGIEIVDAREVISMEDDPSTATRRKKDSSMAVALNLLREGRGDAVVSAGSTGALLTGATLTVKRIRGIRRAAFGPVIPNGGRGVMLIDCGANVECTSEYLLQFAFMGSLYSKHILGCPNPRVGLLNNGTEETKGTELQKQAWTALKRVSDEGRINFIGNIEGSAAFSGDVDVIVTDGFTGNVCLKTIEGTSKTLFKTLKGVMMKTPVTKLGALAIKGGLKELMAQVSPDTYGGAPLLGVKGALLVGHGSSSAFAVKNGVLTTAGVVRAGVSEIIAQTVAKGA